MMPSSQVFKCVDDAYHVIEKKVPYGKVSGTYLAALIGKSKWSTPFITTAKMLRLYEEDISTKKEIIAGHVIEPKILKYIGAMPGEELFGKNEGNHEEWTPHFDDEVFTGHIDGVMPDGAVVEVKTTKNPEDWVKGVPEYYWIQASLYAHFLKTDRIIFMVGLTTPEILADPDSFVPEMGKTVFRYDVGIIPGFDEMLAKAKSIYENTVLQNRTSIPEIGNDMDEKVSDILAAQLWDEKTAGQFADNLKDVQEKLDEVKIWEKKAQDIKDMLMIYMQSHEVDIVSGTNYNAKRSTVTKSVLDADALKRDGIYDAYTKETTYDMIRVSKRR